MRNEGCIAIWGANVGFRLMESSCFKVVAYANDVVILVGGKFLSTLGELMESSLGLLSSWATNYGLNINPNKTHVGLFSRWYKIETFRLPGLDDRELLLSSEEETECSLPV